MPRLADNKRALFDYELIEKFEAGIKLAGHEVKSVRAGRMNLKGSYVVFHGLIPELIGAHISRYAKAGKIDYDPDQTRYLLLKKSQIQHLKSKLEQKGFALIPLAVFTKGSFIKLEVGLCRGKKEYEKREAVKKRSVDRQIQRALKGERVD